MTILQINYDPNGKIVKQLYKLKNHSLNENTQTRKIKKLARYIIKIHSKNIRNQFIKYGAEWVIEQVLKIENMQYKSDIVSALKTMSQVEHRTFSTDKNKSLIWDIVCIMNYMNDSNFSEVFLINYLRHGGTKPSLTELYANLYYIKVIEAVNADDYGDILTVTRKIIDHTMFDTDIVSYETLIKLNITGY